MKPRNGTITDVPGIKVGHATDLTALTGCTVILCERGAVAGVDQRGSAPGTRETDLLNPINTVQKIHAVLLSGGSAFGLDAATGVMRYLQDRRIGFHAGKTRVPIVPAAVLFDLGIGDPNTFPDAGMGYYACKVASTEQVSQGNFGAGAGATIGKILGMGRAVKAGLGSASLYLGRGVVIGAVIAVNAFGDVFNPETGKILAGARALQKRSFRKLAASPWADTEEIMRSIPGQAILKVISSSNTVIGVIATNALLDKSQATKVAQMAWAGLARSIRPASTMLDGDTLFALSTGRRPMDVNIIGAYAARITSLAIRNAVLNAVAVGGVPALSDVLD